MRSSIQREATSSDLCLLVDSSESPGQCQKSRTIRLPIHITEMLNKLKKGQRELSQELGRTPTVTELAEFVELPEDDVKDLMCRARQ